MMTPTETMGGSLGTKLLSFVLGLIAGSADVISFLGLGGLFIAQITGNLAILAAKLVLGGEAPVTNLIAVPVFIVVLALVKLLAAGLGRMRITSLLPLLLMLQFLLLSGSLATCLAAGPHIDPNAANVVFAGMMGVSAMAVQNAVVELSLKGAPSTAVMTTNVTRFMMDLGDLLLGGNANDRARAGERASRTGVTIVGFLVGCGVGALFQALAGLWSFALPTGLALVALVMALAMKLDGARRTASSPSS